MIRLCPSRRHARVEWRKIQQSCSTLRNMGATVDLFRMKAGGNGFGRSSGWWSFVQGLQTVVDAELRRLAERFFQRCLKSGSKELRRAVVSDGHEIFAAPTEFAGNVHSGFVGERHSCCQNC